MITAQVRVTNPDEAKLQLTITATVKEWREVAKVLPTDTWPHWEFASVITNAIRTTVDRVESEHSVTR